MEKSFAAILRELRKSRSLSQGDLAKALSVHQTAVSQWETGRTMPDIDTVTQVAKYFNVSTDYLLGRDDDSQQSPTRSAYELTEKEERDIEKRLEAMLASMDSESGLMFSGEPLDDETRELLAESLRNSMRMARILAKKKYTPKKYRPEEK